MQNKIITFFLVACMAFAARGQGFYDINTIQKIEVTMSQSNWDKLMDDAYATTGDYIMADKIVINGIELDSVGVKYKGNSSYSSNQTKNPWHIELDTYKEQDYDGYTDIKLANVKDDPSFVRDVLGFKIVRQYMDAPLSNYANLYVNGVLIGLYTNTEAITKKFVKSHFGSKSNAFFSCSPPDGANQSTKVYPNLLYLGQDSTSYYTAYEMKSKAGWQELINLCDTLNNHVESIEQVLDIDKVLWMLAFNNAIVNIDSYIGIFSQNYYLYKDDYGRFLPVVWDLNESFGVFSQTGSTDLNSTQSKAQLSHFLHLNDSKWPLIQKLLNMPKYKRMYLAHYKTILNENFANESYYTTGQEIQNIIAESVKADNNKFFTYSDFTTNLTSDLTSSGGGFPGGGFPGGGGPGGGGGGPQVNSAPGIKNLMSQRASYLLSNSDFTNVEPLIDNVTLSNDNPTIGSSITISATVSSANNVTLKYRTKTGAPFVEKQMSNTGDTYSVELENITETTEYYIYAENDNIGKYAPARAAYEYYTITAVAPSTTKDVVINEIVAQNTTIPDQDGDFDDWIELFNNSTETIDLSGYYLSDTESQPLMWQFPNGTSITPNGYLIVWADKDSKQEGLHAGFKLSTSGEFVILSNAEGNIIDKVEFPEQTSDVSYGRYPNGVGDFQYLTPTFGTENMTNSGAKLTKTNDLILSITMNQGVAHIESSEIINTASIYNVAGQLVAITSPHNCVAEIKLNNNSSSLYFVKIVTTNGNSKVVKIYNK